MHGPDPMLVAFGSDRVTPIVGFQLIGELTTSTKTQFGLMAPFDPYNKMN